MIHLRFGMTVCAALVLCGSIPAPARAADALQQKTDALVQPWIEGEIVVGVSIGLIRGDERRTFGYGVMADDDPHPRKPDADTLYEIGSVSKVFTALLLADAVKRGQVTLDQPLAELLPDGVKAPVSGDGGRAVTLADLATHHSGLPRMPDNMPRGDRLNPYADYTLEQMHAFVNGRRLLSRPGTTYLYSNLGSALLGQVLARKLGRSYEDAVRQTICEPLGMKDTVFDVPDALKPRLAAPHDGDARVKGWDLNAFNPAGGIRSSVNDMLRFVEANLGKRPSPLDDAIALSHERRHDIELRPGITGGMALGWHIAGDHSTYWHNGQTGGYHAYVAFNRKHDIGVVLLCNTASMQVDGLGEQLIRMLAGADEQPAKFIKPVKLDTKTLDGYVGTYQIAPLFFLTVTRDGDRLYVQATGQDKYRVYAESPTSFFYRIVEAKIAFDVDEDGKAKSLTLHQNGLEMPGKRVK